jgi:hypothetical protein
MPDKRTINLAVPAELADAFDHACSVYGHGKQKGLILAAAIRMFLDADPTEQGERIRQVFAADVLKGVEAMQLRHAHPPSDHTPRKAAKKRGRSKKPFHG